VIFFAKREPSKASEKRIAPREEKKISKRAFLTQIKRDALCDRAREKEEPNEKIMEGMREPLAEG
jgi:hypothetical protein